MAATKEEYIKQSQAIFQDKAAKLLPANVVKALKEAIFHDSTVSRESLEAQILVEADLIEGVSPERIAAITGKARKEHLEWVRAYFNPKGAFKEIVSIRGQELLFEAIKRFNKADFGFQLPQLRVGQNQNIEITTYRIEAKYSDKRHPDGVKFAKTLAEDLSRRDFSINAMALEQLDAKKGEYKLIDLFGGAVDLQNGVVRAVGDPFERFDEDALRMLRAVRFAVSLGFKLEHKTKQAIVEKVENMAFISQERIRDEFAKIILSANPDRGIKLLVDTGLMQYIIPEVLEAIGVEQNYHHYHGPYNTVYKHLVASLAKCPSQELEVRLAAFLHDIGKPRVKQGTGEQATFYNHEYVGAKLTNKILRRLKFPRKTVEKTVSLVKNHMFYYDVDQVGEAGVRRVVRKVGRENIKDLIDVRIGDRLGSGVPKAVPYKLRHFQYMVEKVSQDPISVKQLKIDGGTLIKELKLQPGPQIGAILEILLAEVIEKPAINQKKHLLQLAKELKDQELTALRKLAKEKIQQETQKEDQKVKQKHWVK